MIDYGNLSGWARFIEEILDGRVYPHPYVRIGPTPPILRKYGLGPFDLAMTPGKIKRVVRDYPEISREIWRNLPQLLANPAAIVPSKYRDGSIIPVLALGTSDVGLVLVPIKPADTVSFNLILSAYEKPDGIAWLEREMRIANSVGLISYVESMWKGVSPPLCRSRGLHPKTLSPRHLVQFQ